jgi:hypothetical protein
LTAEKCDRFSGFIFCNTEEAGRTMGFHRGDRSTEKKKLPAGEEYLFADGLCAALG